MGNHDSYSDPACGGDYRGGSRLPRLFQQLVRKRTASTSTRVTSSSCKHGPWTAGFQLPCDFQKIFCSNSTDQPDGRAAPVVRLFYFQGHVGAFKRNERAMRNNCKDGKLQAGMMLLSRQMPNCQREREVSNRILFRVASGARRVNPMKPDL